MGNYTALNCAFELKKDTPQTVLDILRYMADGTGYLPPLPDHPLFACHRWRSLFTCDSYYFDDQTHTDVLFDDCTDTWYVSVRSNLKNYDGEIGKFFDWVTPYIDKMDGEFVGYHRYEQNEVPTLVFHPNRHFTPAVPKDVCPWDADRRQEKGD